MFYLSKIINKSLIDERCFLSTHDNTCYEFVNFKSEIISKYFLVEKVDIYTNLKINFVYFEELVDLIENINTDLKRLNYNKNIIIDHFGVNLGKLVHFGHLRTLIYGDLIKKIYKYVGFNVKNDSHFGDSDSHIQQYVRWMKDNNYNAEIINNISIKDLNNIYVKLREVNKLNNNFIDKKDKYYIYIRSKIVDVSTEYIKKILKKMNISFDFMYSESRYCSLCDFLVNFGLDNNLFRYDEYNRLVTNNNIVLTNSSNSYLYSFIDIATIIERKLMQMSKIIYVVDKRQSFHFELTFEFIKKIVNIELKHIKYGYIYNKHNEIMSSRHGKNKDILEFIEYYESKGYDILHIRLALYLYEIKHRMQSDYIFMDNLFIDVINEAKTMYNKLKEIENVFIKKII